MLVVAASTSASRLAVARLAGRGDIPRAGVRLAALLLAAAAVVGYQVCFLAAVHATGVASGTVAEIGSVPC